MKRKLILPFLFLIVTAVLVGAKVPAPVSDYALNVTTDRPDALYQEGEKVAFTISVAHLGQPADGTVDWNITKDGVEPPLQKGAATLVHGSAMVSADLKEPGFLQCEAQYTPAAGPALTKLAGAGIDPLKIQPSLPAPQDFDAFWTAEKAKLAAIPLNIHLTPVHSVMPGVVAFDLQADSVGNHLSGYLAYPVDAKPHSLPAMLIPHGAGVMSSYLGVAAGWAKEGFLALDFNVHGLPNGQPHEFYADLAQGDLKEYFWQGRDDREKFFFHDAFLRVVRAIDVLTAQPQWDGKIVIANGRSQGGGQAIAAAGLDQRVTFLCAEIPALCDPTGVVISRANGWPRLAGMPRQLAQGEKPVCDEKIIEASRYYDAVNFAARTKAPAFFTVGFIDRLCPPTTVYAAYNQIPGEKHILNLPTYGHQKTAEGDAGVHQAILDYLKTAHSTP